MAAIAMAHLFELCPRCRREFEAWRQELESQDQEPKSADYEAVLDRIRARVEPPSQESGSGAGESPVDGDLREARSRAEELLRLGPEQQLAWIRSDSDRLAGPLLAEVLIEEGRRRTPGYPHDGYTLTHLARIVLQHAPASPHSVKLYARALAYMANAVRVIGDLPRAEQILGDARYVIHSQAGGDRLARAELDSLEGSLRMEQGRPRDAVSAFLRAQMVYQLENLATETAATLQLLARAHGKLREFGRSFELLDKAEKMLAANPEQHLLIVSASLHVGLLEEAGSPRSAFAALANLEALIEGFDDSVLNTRASWQRGRLSGALGDFDAMEQLLLQVIKELAGRRMVNDLAHAKLELAGLFAEQGRIGEAGDHVEEAASIFREIGLARDAAEAHRVRGRLLNG
jgi:tetratricopeptide (TPR) repeat protein